MKMKETSADEAVRVKALENSGAGLLEIVEAIEDLHERQAELKTQEKAKFAAAKSDGYDPKAIKAAIKARADTDEAKAAREALGQTTQLYLEALELAAVLE